MRWEKWRRTLKAHYPRTVFPTARSLLIRSSLERLDLSGFTSVLVVGAGKDPYRRLFGAPRRYITLDLVDKPGYIDVVADAHAIPFADATFDCVFAAEVVEHLSSPLRFSAEAHRVLVAGGQLILTVPFLFHMHDDPRDYWRFTADGLRELLKNFETVDVISQGNRLHVLSDLITSAFGPVPFLLPLRGLNHLLRLSLGGDLRDSNSSAPSGFLVFARKH